MTINPWLIIAIVVVVLVLAAAVGLFVWWRRRQEPNLACPRCKTEFDPDVWTVRNKRQHYKGRHTITPVYKCPKCGLELNPLEML